MSHAAATAAATMRCRGRGVVWGAGLLVALGAGVATAHGLYEVAIAAHVPAAIAWLYPLITDGLALVAYAATARLHDAGRGYAWSVIVLAAGLSGLAQATYLAGTVATTAPIGLRFGVGAWPAIAAAIVAHLLHLLGPQGAAGAVTDADEPQPSYGSLDAAVRLDGAASTSHAAVQPPVQPSNPAVQQPYNPARDGVQPTDGANGASARERALAAAREHHSRHGQLPTVTQLMTLAQVARGTAGTALQDTPRRTPSPAHCPRQSRRQDRAMTAHPRTQRTKRPDASRTRHRAKPQDQAHDQDLSEDRNPKIKGSTHQCITIRRVAESPPGADTRPAREAPC